MNNARIYVALVLSGLSLLLGTSCQEETCIQGEPRAIFADDTPGVAVHRFSLGDDGQSAEELLTLASGEELTVLQRGCDHLIQEYRFLVPGEVTPEQENDPYFWLATLLKRLDQLRNLGAEYVQYGQYVQALAEQAENWQIGETQELGPGFYARVDVVSSQQSNILLLILSDQP